VFCAGVDHANKVADRLRGLVGIHAVECLTGETSKQDRERITDAFKCGHIKYLCNVNVLTEGFDATRVDMVVLLRATLSPGLYYQMVGRGLRLHEGKADCMVLDFGGNVLTHGPIDAIRVRGQSSGQGGEAPAKTCPECAEVVPIAYSNCTACGFAFPEPEPKPRHEPRASDAAILSEDERAVVYQVTEVQYATHYKKDWQDGDPRTMRVDYFDGICKLASEWVCIEHSGFARNKAIAGWGARTAVNFPVTADLAVSIASLDLIAKPNQITVRKVPGTRIDAIIDYDFEGVEIEQVDQQWLDDHLDRAFVESDDEVPF
jgi:DNA repair protein RadD